MELCVRRATLGTFDDAATTVAAVKPCACSTPLRAAAGFDRYTAAERPA